MDLSKSIHRPNPLQKQMIVKIARGMIDYYMHDTRVLNALINKGCVTTDRGEVKLTPLGMAYAALHFPAPKGTDTMEHMRLAWANLAQLQGENIV